RGGGVPGAAVAAVAPRRRGGDRGGRGLRGAADHPGAALGPAGAGRRPGRRGRGSAPPPPGGGPGRAPRPVRSVRHRRRGRRGGAMSLLWVAGIAAWVLSFGPEWLGSR